MKYMLISELSDYALVSNNKAKLIKEAKNYAKSEYKAYKECCTIMNEKEALSIADFITEYVEKYNQTDINKLLAYKYEVYEV